MRTSLLIVVPCILLAGLIFGVFKLSGFLGGDTPCVVGACPLALYEGNTGDRLVYSVGTRFTVTLDERKELERFLECSPEGIIGSVPDAPPSTPPLYTVAFEAKSPGTCALAGGVFIATIVVE